MGVKFKIESSKFQNTLRGFLDGDDFTPNLVANIGEVILARHLISLTWDASSSIASPWTIQEVVTDVTYTLTRASGSFLSDGFQVGQRVEVYHNFATKAKTATVDITSISEDGTILEFDVFAFASAIRFNAFAEGITTFGLWADATLPQNLHDSLIFRYNLIGNDEEFNAVSLQSGALQVFYVPTLPDGSTASLIPLGVDRSWVTGALVAGLKVYGGAGLTNDVVPMSQVYEVFHYFLVNPLFKLGDLEFLEGDSPPDYLVGDLSFKYAFEFVVRQGLNDVNSEKKLSVTSNKGSVGYFNENFDGFNNEYVVDDINYKDGATLANADGLLIVGSTRVTITISNNLASISAGTKATVSVFRLPESETEYQATASDMLDNFMFDYITPTEGAGNTLGSRIFTRAEANLDGPSIIIECDLTFPNDFKERITRGDRFVIAVLIEDGSTDPESSDKVNLIADVGSFQQGAFIEGLINFTDLSLYNVNDVVGLQDPQPTLTAFNESGLLVRFGFDLDLAKEAFLTSLIGKLVAYKDADGTYFELDSFTIDLSDGVVSGGVQNFNLSTTRGYLLPDGADFNQVTLTTGALVGDLQSYSGYWGQKIKWQDWIRNAQADGVFFNAMENQNNLNFKTSNYSGLEGYSIRILMQAQLTGIDPLGRAGLGFHEEFTDALEILDYEVAKGQTITATLTTRDPDTLADTGGALLRNKDTLFEIVWNLQNGAINSEAEWWVAHRIQKTGSLGDDISEFTSAIEDVSGLLKPVSGETYVKKVLAGNVLTSTCLVDYTKLDSNASYDLSGEVSNAPAAPFDLILSLSFTDSLEFEGTEPVTI